MLTEGEIKRKRTVSLCLSVCVCLSLSMPCLIHVYVLSDDMKYKKREIFTIQNMYMHAYKTLLKLGAK